MNENAPSVDEVILRSISAWRSNPVLCVPFLLNVVTALFLFSVYSTFVFFYANPFSNAVYTDYLSLLKSINYVLLILDLCLAFFLFIVMMLASSYFAAGAIGMSMTALKKGKTSLDDLFHYGNANFTKIFLANIIILFLAAAIIVFVLMIQIFLHGEYVSIASIILTILFAPVPYAIILSNTGIREGLKRGTNLALDNKLEALLIYVFTTSLTSLITFAALCAAGIIAAGAVALMPITELSYASISSAMQSNIPLIAAGFVVCATTYLIVLIFIAEPITTLCWANFYLSRGKR